MNTPQSIFMYLDQRLGEKYGRLKVTGLDDRGGQHRWYVCLCECGEHRSVIERRLLSGQVVECVKCEVKRKMERPRSLPSESSTQTAPMLRPTIIAIPSKPGEESEASRISQHRRGWLW